MKPVRLLRNPLIKRLRRHENLASLFRAPQNLPNATAENQTPHPEADAGSGLPLSKAFIPLDEPVPAAEAGLPIDPAAPFPRPVQTLDPEPGSTRTRPVPSKPHRGETQPETDTAAPAPPPPVASPETGPTVEEDPVWKRLQNIFNKHRQKNQTRESKTPPQPGESPPAQPGDLSTELDFPGSVEPQNKTTGLETPKIKPETREEAPAGLAPDKDRVQRQPGPDQPALPAAHPPQAPGSDRESDKPKQTEGEGPSNAALKAAPLSPGVEDPESGNLPPDTSPGKPPPPEASLDQDPGPIPPSPHPEQVEAGPGAGPAMPPQPVTEPRPGPEMQAVPLEEVWSVQRRNPPVGAPSPSGTGASAASGEGEPVPGMEPGQTIPASAPKPVPGKEFIRQTLHTILPSRTSASGIEFIPPRQPRPSLVPETTVLNRGTMEQGRAEIQTRSEPPGHETHQPGSVQTEIGPLPGDLWQLIGAPSPGGNSSAEMPDLHPVQAPPPPGFSPLAEAHTPDSPISPNYHPRVSAPAAARSGDVPTVVQREAAATQSTEPDMDSETRGTTRGDKSGGEAEVDLDELARQVYAELRYRLELEWERAHRS